MNTLEELQLLESERSNNTISGCIVCEYGHSRCTCSAYDQEDYEDYDPDYIPEDEDYDPDYIPEEDSPES